VLGGDAGGWRLGLGVLQNRGIAGWLAAWDDLPAPDPDPAGRPPACPAPGSGDQLVAVADAALRARSLNVQDVNWASDHCG
jgi:hypothetical protein